MARQLGALGSPRYDLLILEVATGEHLHHRSGLTPPGVAAAIPWLKHLNAYGCEILVRPSAPAGLTHFEGVHLGAVREASAAGFQAAAVLRAPDGGREVWMRGGADLPPAVQDLVDRELARRLRPGRAAQTPGYGHLAGFTSPFAQRAGGLERPPFLTLEEDGGRVYGGFRALAAEARARAAAEVLEQRVEREIAGLGRQPVAAGEAGVEGDRGADVASAREGLAREGSAREVLPREGSARVEGEMDGSGARAAAAASAPAAAEAGGTSPRAAAARPASRQAALREMLAITDQEAERRGLAGAPRSPSPAEIEQQLARWSAARQAHAEALAAAGGEIHDGSRGAVPYRLEARVVATFRAQEAIRHELAERLGVREVPAELPAEAAVALARWQASLSGAEERLDRLLLEPGATASDRLEGAIAVRTLREELADAARERGLTLREAAPGVAAGGLVAAGERADTAVEIGMGLRAAADLPAPSELAVAALQPAGERAGTLGAAEIGAPPEAGAALPMSAEVPTGGLQAGGERAGTGVVAEVEAAPAAAATLPASSELAVAGLQPVTEGAGTVDGAELGRGSAAAAAWPVPPELPAAGLLPSPGSEAAQARPGPRAVMEREVGAAAARSMDAPDDEVLVSAYDDTAIPYSAERHAAGWREELAAELSLEARETALRAELLALERAHERASLLLEGLESRIESQPTSARLAAHETVVATVLELEERQVPVAERVAYLANHRVGRELGRLRRILEREPTGEAIAALTRVLDE
ncbi:MAG TPA: hypothetical protein VHB47_11935, partial [Thermoanaerobaculia bacterium]|nr:hypothetical protein [Thermoanaerobaculia bacterium]